MAAQLDKATEDFLKRTAGGSDTAAPGTVDPETERFLMRTGAAPPAKTEAPATQFDEYGRPLPSVEGGGQGLSMQQLHEALQYAPDTIYGSPNVNFPNAPMGGNPLGALSPFARDVKTGESRLTLPPMLRDIGLTLTDPKGLGNWLTFNPQTNTYNLSPEAMTTATLGARPLRFSTPEVPPAVPQAGPRPGEAPPESGPSPAGAQVTPTGQAGLTPEQAAEYGSTADKQWLYKSMPAGEANTTEYIPGINPTMAQREQTAIAARETKTARNLSPEADQAERELLDEHNTKRKDFFQELAGSDVTQGIAVRDAEKNINDGLAAAWRHGGQVDPQSITGAIQAELEAPAGKLPAVKAVMKTVGDALQKSDGSGLETDPRQVYGVRRVINFLQSKRGLAENPAYGDRDVQAALIRVKQAIDGAMEPAAPGFGAAISDFSMAQRAIEAREALQTAEPKLYDDKGRMQFSRIHRFMNDVIKSRDPNAPLNPYQSLTEDQMNRLKSLHDDLMRVASAEDLAKARGSDTMPNFLDAVKQAAQGIPGTVAASIAGHLFGGPGGAVVAPVIKGQIENLFTRRAEGAATKKMENLLRPDPTKYPTKPNPLLNPNTPP